MNGERTKKKGKEEKRTKTYSISGLENRKQSTYTNMQSQITCFALCAAHNSQLAKVVCQFKYHDNTTRNIFWDRRRHTVLQKETPNPKTNTSQRTCSCKTDQSLSPLKQSTAPLSNELHPFDRLQILLCDGCNFHWCTKLIRGKK